MKRLAFLLALIFAPLAAMAQSTATPVVTGYLTTSGCPTGQTACFVQYGPGSGGGAAPYAFTSTGFQQVSVSSSAVGFTPGTGSTVCFIQTETEPVRYRTDGTAPTASVGMLLSTGQQLQLTASLTTVKFIATTGTATLDVDCYK